METIYIYDKGKGFPLVLIHGFLGSSEMWCNQKDYFSDFSRVIAPALPGFGESSNIKSLNSINQMAMEILKALDKKKIGRFNLLGHSMGGMVVQEITKIASERVNKLLCISTGPIGEIPGRYETIDETRKKLRTEGIEKIFIKASKKWFVKGDKDKNYYLCKNALKNVSLETVDNALIAMKNWSGYENLKNINNDTLIVWGDKDNSYNFDQVNTLNKNIKNSRLEIFKDCSHNLHLEKIKEFNFLIKDFISK